MNTSLLQTNVSVPVGTISVEGQLTIPPNAQGLVLFAHGSGSSRFSPRNNLVASVLNRDRLGTFLFDLLTRQEDQAYANRFDIPLLTDRLVTVTEWVFQQPSTRSLSVGYFGASTGAASALGAAARLGNRIKAVVSRGGRPDLALPVLEQVSAPVLLLVGSLDQAVMRFNEQAYARLQSEKEIRLVPDASHLFEEPGKLEEVATLATQWFVHHLSTSHAQTA